MKFTGENVLAAPVEQAWDALLDPAVLVRTIPGCERLEATGDNAYAMTVTAGVASIKGTYAGSCVLTDLVEHESLVMKLDGAGAPGTIGATVNVRFTPEGSSTRVSYDADAVVGGMIGGVGQRMLTSVSRRMAGEFFGNVGRRDRRRPGRRGGHRSRGARRSSPARPRPPGAGLHRPGQGVAAGLAAGLPHRRGRRRRARGRSASSSVGSSVVGDDRR